MDQVVPWSRRLGLLEPFYPQAATGRKRLGLEVLLRIYFLQQWYGLSDPAAEEVLYDIESMRRFVGLALNEDAIPEQTTMLNFRHLLEAHDLTGVLLEAVVFKKIYEDECHVTQEINSLVDADLAEKDYSTFNFPQWYVAEQHEEERLFKSILDKIRIIGTEGRGLYHFDQQMSQPANARKGVPAA